MSPAIIRWEVPAPGVARVVLHRPERLNAYNPRFCHELLAAINRYRTDDDLRALIVTGSGRGFCAGGDIRGDPELNEVLGAQMGRARELAEDMHAVNRTLYELDKPVIAAVNGVAVAGGLTLALMCDFRIAAESARLGDTSGRVGLLPDEGGAWVFPRFMGYERALHMVLWSEIYDAVTAKELGLVTEVVPDEALTDRAVEVASELVAKPPLTVRVAKRLLRRGLETSFEQSLGDAQMAVMWLNVTADTREGMAAFAEKRPPRFTGH